MHQSWERAGISKPCTTPEFGFHPLPIAKLQLQHYSTATQKFPVSKNCAHPGFLWLRNSLFNSFCLCTKPIYDLKGGFGWRKKNHPITSLHLNLEARGLPGYIDAPGWSFHLTCVTLQRSLAQQPPDLSAALGHTSGQAGEGFHGEPKWLMLKARVHLDL